MNVGPGAAHNIALTQQRGDITRHLSQAHVMPAQQLVRDTWMCGQLGHRFAMRGKFPAAIHLLAQCAQTLQQLLGLCITCRWRRIKPDQLVRGHPPTRQLQRQPCQICLQDFSAAIGGQLRVLVF